MNDYIMIYGSYADKDFVAFRSEKTLEEIQSDQQLIQRILKNVIKERYHWTIYNDLPVVIKQTKFKIY